MQTSPTPVRPLAAVTVAPDDFPFIEAVHRHARSESEDELEARLRAGST
jgi:hypothetical protein